MLSKLAGIKTAIKTRDYEKYLSAMEPSSAWSEEFRPVGRAVIINRLLAFKSTDPEILHPRKAELDIVYEILKTSKNPEAALVLIRQKSPRSLYKPDKQIQQLQNNIGFELELGPNGVEQETRIMDEFKKSMKKNAYEQNAARKLQSQYSTAEFATIVAPQVIQSMIMDDLASL